MKSQNIEFKEKIWKFPRKKLLEVMYKEKKITLASKFLIKLEDNGKRSQKFWPKIIFTDHWRSRQTTNQMES